MSVDKRAAQFYANDFGVPLVEAERRLLIQGYSSELLQAIEQELYDVDQNRPAQPAAVVSGKFEWKDGCLYLVDNNGEYMTPLFPKYPKGIVKWNEATKTLNLNGRVFKMGGYIKTNGSYHRYTPNTVGGAEYEKQVDKKCLTPTVAMIGTFFD